MWEKVKIRLYNPHTNKVEEVLVEGINKEGLLISRAAEFAIVVEKQIIRNAILERLQEKLKKGQINNLENQINIATLDNMTFFTYKDREILLLHPVGGAPLMECAVQDAYSLGANFFVRLGTTGSLSKDIPKYSFIATTSSIRHDKTSDYYLPEGFPAIPSKTLHQRVVSQLRKKGVQVTEGVSYTTATRFKENVPYLLELNKKLGVLNIEMESATLFSVATELGIHAASLSIVTDCLADEGELENVEGTLVGIPKYQEYMEEGLKGLIQALDPILEAFSELPSGSKKFIELNKSIQKLNPNPKATK